MVSWLAVLLALVLVYLLYKVVVFARADAYLTLLSKTLNSKYFDNKVVWVTGASSGIGEELCYQLSRLGARLILTARSEDKLKVVMKGLAKPNQAKILPVDLSDPSATRAATEKAKALFGEIDILVSNAGVSTRSSFIDMQESTHRRLLEIDLFAPWILSHDVLPGMMSSGFGHIVVIDSVLGKFGTKGKSSLAAAKFGVLGMMDSLQCEVSGSNVHVSVVCPGLVKTNISENALLPDGSLNNKKDPHVEGGMAPQRCAGLILSAVSNQLSEVWISDHPFLYMTYLAQYTPSLAKYLLHRRARQPECNNKKTS